VRKWFKKHWEWVAAGVVALFAFLLGRRGRKLDDEFVKNKEKEIDIIEQSAEEEDAKKKEALERFLHEQKKLREEYNKAQTELQRETAQRKIELLEAAKENPEEIDKILMEEFNINAFKK